MSGHPHRDRWLEEIRAKAIMCEALRPLTRKPKSTGTLSEAACVYLRSIVEAVQPQMCIEIGTFIGTSALVLAATGATVYTCDKDNAAFTSRDQIVCYGKTASTTMLRELVARQLRADLFFFDGRIQPEDVPLIRSLSHARTAYAFDDYERREKGVINVEKLSAWLPAHRLVPPPRDVLGLPSKTTIAALLP